MEDFNKSEDNVNIDERLKMILQTPPVMLSKDTDIPLNLWKSAKGTPIKHQDILEADPVLHQIVHDPNLKLTIQGEKLFNNYNLPYMYYG